ncbi:MAG: DNA-directed RNA polymerase subunit beta' [Patescibacteria group bacterium]
MASFSEYDDFQGLTIRLASPKTIRAWSHGEVLEPETINYRTYRAEKDGLFCEKIFGPTKDYQCYCGKYSKVRFKGVICDKCGVEVTRRSVRRERMGHIELASPCAHIWFFGTIPSKMARLMGISPSDLEGVVYYSRYLVLDCDTDKQEEILDNLDSDCTEEKQNLVDETEEEIEELLAEAEKEAEEYRQEGDEDKAEGTMLAARKEAASMRDEVVVTQGNIDRKYEVLREHLSEVHYLGTIGESEYNQLSSYLDQFADVGMGGETVQKALEELDLDSLTKRLREQIEETGSKAKKKKYVSRLKVTEQLRNSDVNPSWMVLDVLPVIPPELRPMVQLEGGRFATSDLNDLYRVIINRNNRLKNLLELGAPDIILRNEKRMLQEAVDGLISGRRTSNRRGGKELRSLSDLIKGKQGRFRRNLLGKRVDYSGRSVIVPGPELAVDECGIPKEMALELFKPMVLREILQEGLAPNSRMAKEFLDGRSAEVWDILERVVQDHPVLLNRAPTLHRLGIVAFYPRLVEGHAIKLHPCVCTGFNADFDGDQMAVHLPLTKEAIQEAKEIMLSTNNLLKPASGVPIVKPEKEMVLGAYWLTKIEESEEKVEKPFIQEEARLAFEQGAIGLRSPIEVDVEGEILETSWGRVVFNDILPDSLTFVNELVDGDKLVDLVATCLDIEGRERTVELVDDLKDLGFKYATRSALSMGIFDTQSVAGKEKIVREAIEKDAEIERNLTRGLITLEEKRRLAQEIWLDATNQLENLAWDSLDEENPVRMLVDSKTRGSKNQVKQMMGMKGLVVDPTGTIVELPTKSNYFEGLNEFEYYAGTRGSRKGLVDTALRTADAGYLTRRLVDVAQEVLVREEDCGSEEGWEVRANEGEQFRSLAERIRGRVVAKTVYDPEGNLVARRNDVIDKDRAEEIEAADVESVWIRSPLTCNSSWGVCQKCYGMDLGWNELVKVGAPVGIIAAESIGEPGTQLTLHGKQAGRGIVGAMEITQGLPRVEQLVEAREPKVLANMSTISGRVSIEEKDEETLITIEDEEGKQEQHVVPPTMNVLVEDGQLVGEGVSLSSGYLDPEEILDVLGVKEAQRYLLSEIKKVYSSQGVVLNDKHIEIILRQMFSKVRVTSSGDTNLLPGEIVDKDRFEIENAEVDDKAEAEQLVLGVTRVALNSESWLSGASFQATTHVLAGSAAESACDPLRGLKENVIVGRKIPVYPEDHQEE